MSLREEMWRYEKLTGESAEHIPIIRLGAFLDGVDKGIEELENIKARLNHRANEHLDGDYYVCIKDLNEVFDEELTKLKGE